MNEWFSVDGLYLNIDKTNAVKFSSNHLQNDLFQITHQNKTRMEATNIKFLGLELGKHMNWKNHIVNIVQKISTRCYAVRAVYHFHSLTTLKMVYFAYFHSIMEYGIIFWGNSTESNYSEL
jgi:hypothetical protein